MILSPIFLQAACSTPLVLIRQWKLLLPDWRKGSGFLWALSVGLRKDIISSSYPQNILIFSYFYFLLAWSLLWKHFSTSYHEIPVTRIQSNKAHEPGHGSVLQKLRALLIPDLVLCLLHLFRNQVFYWSTKKYCTLPACLPACHEHTSVQLESSFFHSKHEKIYLYLSFLDCGSESQITWFIISSYFPDTSV